MNNKNKWVDLSIPDLCIVAMLGLALRNKIVFALPFINYNHLLEAHPHFTIWGKLFTGLAIAAFIAWKLIVIIVITIAEMPVITNTNGLTVIL